MSYESPVVYNLDSGSGSNGSNGNGMFGGGWDAWIVIILFALIFGNNWGNNRGNDGGSGNMPTFIPYPTSSIGGFNAAGALTRADLCSEFNFNNLDSAVRGVANGICSLGYDQLAQINGVNSNIAAGFAGVNNAVCTLGYQNAQLINGLENTVQNGFNASNVVALQNQNALQSQLASCCCDIREGIQGINYNMATNTCAITNAMNTNTRDIIDSQNAGTRAILDYLCQEKISDLQNENQALRLSASQQAQNNYLISQLRPTPVPAYPASSPCGLGNWSPAVLAGGYGYSNGCCGCNG